jgi:hypothetical protein
MLQRELKQQIERQARLLGETGAAGCGSTRGTSSCSEIISVFYSQQLAE